MDGTSVTALTGLRRDRPADPRRRAFAALDAAIVRALDAAERRHRTRPTDPELRAALVAARQAFADPIPNALRPIRSPPPRPTATVVALALAGTALGVALAINHSYTPAMSSDIGLLYSNAGWVVVPVTMTDQSSTERRQAGVFRSGKQPSAASYAAGIEDVDAWITGYIISD